jgi:ubiquinone/menaquinone biosynthesis C-methylase UbiE
LPRRIAGAQEPTSGWRRGPLQAAHPTLKSLAEQLKSSRLRHAENIMTDFVEVTELAGDEVSNEQIDRVRTRYAWALGFCSGRDVLEVACGTGPGLGLLQARARSLVAGDISDDILARARAHYGTRVDIRRLDAMDLPMPDRSLDVIVIFEALYYVPDAARFASECARVLRPGGVVLVSNANKDLFDFNPSPHSHVYHGVVELGDLFGAFGFNTEFWGDVAVASVSWRQKVLRPIKKLVVSMGLMPKSMAGKKLLKRLVFGHMQAFPREIAADGTLSADRLVKLPGGVPDRHYKVVLCAATLPG